MEHDLTGVPKNVPLFAPTIRDSYLERAARLVHGYYEMRDGKLHFEIDVEDAATHRMIQTVALDGAVREAMDRAAKTLVPDAHAFPAPDDAAAAWGHSDYERAVMLDPAFAWAWLGWIEQLTAMNDAAGARQVADRALAQTTLRPATDRARLELAAATLRQDDTGRLAAARRLVELIPYDTALLAGLAKEEMAARRFADAARDYRTLAGEDKGDPAILNAWGYAEAFAGDLEGARKTFEEYGRGRDDAPVNALDSMGEAYFINGKFDQAAPEFLDAYKKNADFLQGQTLFKAALARWLGGDLPAADQIANQYFEDRAKARDLRVVWRRASWLYETGRQQQAEELLMHAPPELAPLAKQQLQVWSSQSFPSDLAELEQMYRRSDPTQDGFVRALYAEALVRAGKRDQARELIQLWPLPDKEDSPLASLVYPKFIELRKALATP